MPAIPFQLITWDEAVPRTAAAIPSIRETVLALPMDAFNRFAACDQTLCRSHTPATAALPPTTLTPRF
ncbi:hypothetical protein GCM10012280_15190 [Wenjunlia tyrosinilytica]|uniref:Uncharacterized protein n=1 Tax=Wenjunlia tyrosinilytica TaxID=1544741 RepID=A0A917ZL28_9ACTN|nr:hypothetical protein GCM10012280_15190 [Wenjunlia tyrosinilytica]